MASKTARLDPAKAFRLARLLERHARLHNPDAVDLMKQVVAVLAVDALLLLKSVPSLSPETLAIAVLMESPGLSDLQVAKRSGCNRSTLSRSARYARCREMLGRGRETVPHTTR